jgi:hypothetical protein
MTYLNAGNHFVVEENIGIASVLLTYYSLGPEAP